MSQFLHTVRFFVGMAMLAGAVALAQPFVAAVMVARGYQPNDAGQSGSMTGMPPGLPSVAIGPAGHAIPDPRPAVGVGGMPGLQPPAGEQFHAEQVHAVQPPPPPAPLPGSALDFSPAAPALDGTYRSTVEIPPPPLLDFHAPPPLSAGWAVHDVARPAAANPVVQPSSTPADYVVRDGDDLTAIALKVYGHAGAATAIWAANKDRIADPQVLPIGMALRLPPTWTLPAAHVAQGGVSGLAIEPTFNANRAGEQTRGGSVREAAAPHAERGGDAFWLQGSQGQQATTPATFAAGAGRRSNGEGMPAPMAATQRPGTVRVGMGDSLESIAVRFYGDRTMASRIWLANRDRLRSPDLLVPGAELRLP